MNRLLNFTLSLSLVLLVLEFSSQNCDPIEYSVFYDSQFTIVPDEIQTGEVECYGITPPFGFQVGAIWSNATIDLQNSFEYSYYVNLGSNDDDGADGIVFVLSGDPAGQLAIGETGGFLSYGGLGGISPSIALEFDTWNNGPITADIFNDHAMLHLNGIMDGSSGPAIDLGNIEDGEYHLVEVVWDAVGMNLTISFDGDVILEENIDLVNDVFNGNPEVLIGFTGSTGGSFNTQIVCDVQVIYTEICNGLDDDCDGEIDEDVELQYFDEVFICQGESYSVGDSEYTFTGQYIDVFQNALGCDSIVNTDLTVGEVITYINEITLCDGESYTEGSSVYEESGVYFDVYQNSEGCDSIIQTELTVGPLFDIVNNVSICDGEVYVEGNSVYTESGNYIDVYQTQFGCDSIVSTELQVFDLNSTFFDLELCEGETYSSPLGDYNVTGSYQEIYVNQNGCDSVVDFDLLVKPVFVTDQQRFICSGGVFEVGSSSYTEPGEYTDILTSSNGCDSVLNTFLGVIDELIIPDSVLCENNVFNLDMNPFPFHEVQGSSGFEDGFYVFQTDGTYNVSVDLDGCILSDDFQLTFLPIYFTETQRLELCSDESLTLEGRELPLDFAWLSGEATESIVVFNGGEYVKEYEYECGDFQDRFVVESKKCNCSVFLPSAFTPDNDGVNDTYGIEFDCEFAQYEFKIYDRYGMQVFYSTDPDERWNGGVGEYYLPTGLYQYILKYSANDPAVAKDELVRGVVTVVR
ncbi:MAG: T9SS type B sorting domain-containing protein [Flavobacteriales bacterium]|nr:T9SS type B sorting domain-containing protein [Flavobacteriales bacterium]